jgi:hypothetical protein
MSIKHDNMYCLYCRENNYIDLKSEKEIMKLLEKCSKSFSRIINNNYIHNEFFLYEYCKHAVEKNIWNIKYVPISVQQKNPIFFSKFWEKVIKISPYYLDNVPQIYSEDTMIILYDIAVSNGNGTAIRFIPQKYQTIDIISKALQRSKYEDRNGLFSFIKHDNKCEITNLAVKLGYVLENQKDKLYLK